MDSNATCGYNGCARPAGVLIGYWVFEDNRCRPFRLEGNRLSCEEHAAVVAIEAYKEKLVPDRVSSESLVVVDEKISPNKVMVYRLGEDSFTRVPRNNIQKDVYQTLRALVELAPA